MSAYGGGNGNNLQTVKAGPGTIYIKSGKSPKLVHKLSIVGDVDSSVQQQTKAYISGDASKSEFTYNILTLAGKLFLCPRIERSGVYCFWPVCHCMCVCVPKLKPKL
ncbi:hypothetical protein DPMN_117949 [Dreissena polymorpha]|uniref:Uncharacterized protein n=1 Tax=Dreissena polymorpha TaxID=45954 RepID=A0A9D4GJA2_DREPO|nr:hypothetical protein DPMN_117949 [Dreissena polymorpha]